MKLRTRHALLTMLLLSFPLAAPGNEPARPLTARGLDNLVAFTRLLGYVRYFHPSDQAAAADWDKVAIAGVQAAEKAGSPEELARVMEDFFRPLAPTVRVYPTGGPRPALPAELTPPAGDPEAVYWEHLGVKTNSDRPSLYTSQRVGSHRSAPAEGGGVFQTLDAEPYRGKRLVLRAAARADVQGPQKAELRLMAYRRGGVELPPVKAEITAGDWRVYEAAVEVPQDAAGVVVGLALASEGRVWWDDVSLEAAGAPVKLENAGFEEAGLAGWKLASSDQRAGYQAAPSEDHPKTGLRSLLVSFSKPDTASRPRPGEPLVADLGGGVSAMVPLALYKGDEDKKDGNGLKPPAPPEGFVPSGNDRTTRLADVALAWNVFQHFYPYFDVVQTDWPAELRRALATAATDADERAFVGTLQRLVAALHDGHGNAYLTAQSEKGHIPLLWDWVEGQIVVTKAAEGAQGLRAGDVILTLDGKPAREALAAEEEKASGATEQWRRWRTLERMLFGKKGDSVRIEARHPNGEAVTAMLSSSLPAFGEGSLQETRPEKIAEIRPGIFYVDIGRISDEDFEGALGRLAAARGIVFDLRGYPSLSTAVIAHLTDRPVSSARWTVPIVTRPDRQGWEWDVSSWDVHPRQPRLKAKAAFMTDGRAISFAETYMGIVEHYKLAEIVGSATAGTNGNVNPFKLPGGYEVIWTGMRVLKQDGSQHHGIGILPTVPVSPTLKGVAAGRDEVLEKAVEVVSP